MTSGPEDAGRRGADDPEKRDHTPEGFEPPTDLPPKEDPEAEPPAAAPSPHAKDRPRTPRLDRGGAMAHFHDEEGRFLVEADGTSISIDRRRIRKLLFGFLLLLVLVVIPRPPDLSVDAQRSIALFAFIVYLWISEALPLPVTALLAGVGLLLLGIKDDPNAAFEPYAQDTFFFILGSLILADGIAKSGADEVLAQRILKIFGHNTHSLLFGVIASTALLAAFVSDHAIAAIMLPIVLGVLRNTGLIGRPRVAAAYLIAIAFAANIAGLATPSGGSRNAIALGYMRDLHGVNVSYLDWMIHAAPLTLVLIPITYLVLAAVFRVPYTRIDRRTLETDKSFTPKQWTAVGILAFTVALWIMASETIGLGAVAIIGAVLMFIAGILDWEDTRSTIPWGVAFVYGAALVMGRVLTQTGAATWLAEHAFLVLPTSEILLIILAVVLLTVLMTNFLSDGATVAVIAPITLSLALLAGYSIESMGILTAVTSAFSFILVIGTPPNIIVYASGLVRPKEFLKAGIPMTLVALALLLIAVFWYWPQIGM